jgi:hypothetical protein
MEAYEVDRLVPAFLRVDMWAVFPGLWTLKYAGLRGMVEFDYLRYIQLYNVVRAHMMRVWAWLVLKLKELEVWARRLSEGPVWLHVPGLAGLSGAFVTLLRCAWWAIRMVLEVYRWCRSGEASAL